LDAPSKDDAWVNGTVVRRTRVPSRWWYALAAVVMLLGTALIALGVAWPLVAMARGFEVGQRVLVPGASVIRLDEPGDYTVYHEHVVRDGAPLLSGTSTLACSLVSRATGREIPLKAPSVSMSYAVSGRSGVAVWCFHAPQAGDYELTGRYPDGAKGAGPITLTVGRDTLRQALVGVFLFLPLGAGHWVVALVIFVVAFARRSGSRMAPLASGEAAGSWSTGSP
jgi:hypothetical protein